METSKLLRESYVCYIHTCIETTDDQNEEECGFIGENLSKFVAVVKPKAFLMNVFTGHGREFSWAKELVLHRQICHLNIPYDLFT